MAKVFATPKPDMRVRKPDGSLLLAEGEPVERDSFWLRRENDGDVTLSEVPAPVVEEASDEATDVIPPAVVEVATTTAKAKK